MSDINEYGEDHEVMVENEFEIKDDPDGVDTTPDTEPPPPPPVHEDVKKAYTLIARFVKYEHTDVSSEDIKNILYSEHITNELRYYLIPISLYIVKKELAKLKSNTSK